MRDLATIEVRSVGDTAALAARLASIVVGGDFVALSGELGAGKTTFTKAFAHALGVTDMVTSPTFTLLSTYETGTDATVRQLLHADLYRLNHPDEADDLALDEVVDAASVCVIEWPERGPRWLVARAIVVSIAIDDDDDDLDARLITVSIPEALGDRGERITAALGGLR